MVSTKLLVCHGRGVVAGASSPGWADGGGSEFVESTILASLQVSEPVVFGFLLQCDIVITFFSFSFFFEKLYTSYFLIRF